MNKLHLAALGFYSGLAFLLLHPILLSTGQKVAGYDFFAYNWNFWWVREALLDPDLAVFRGDFIMFPAESSYGFHTLTIAWFPLWALTEPLIGSLGAVNLILFLGCVLNAYALFAWLRSEHIPPGLALLGGMMLQVLPISRYFYYNTHLNLFAWFWLPLHLLLWKKVAGEAEAGRWRGVFLWGGVQSLGLWLLAHTDLQFPIFAAALLAPYGLRSLFHSSKRGALLLTGGGIVAGALLGFWFAGPFPYMLDFAGTRAISPVEDRPGVDFPEDFLYTSPTWWDWATPSVGAFVTGVLVFSFGFSLIGALRAGRPADDRWFWFLWMLPPLILALGPTLEIFGQAIPLPYRWLYALTEGMQRMPWRFAPIFVIALAVFAGKTWADKLPPRPYRAWAGAVLFLLLAADVRLHEGGPLQDMLPHYEFYERIGQEEGDYGLVEVPTGAGTGEVLLGDLRAIQFQYYGIIHQKRMVNGFLARAPLEHYWYLYLDDPLMAWLGQRRPLEPEAAAALLAERVLAWPIGYMVVHQDYVRANGGRPEEIFGFLNGQGDSVCPVWVEGEAVVYRARSHPLGCPARTPPQAETGAYVIDIGAAGDEVYLGPGWHYREAVAGLSLRWLGQAEQTRLYFDLPPGNYRLEVQAQAFWEPRQVGVRVNGIELAERYTLGPEGLGVYTFELPAEIVGQGGVEWVWLYDGRPSPAEVGLGGDVRPLAIAVDWLHFHPQD